LTNVLIVSISRDEQRALTVAASNVNNREFSFETTASFGQESSWWTTAGPDVLILCMPADDLMQGYFMTKLKQDVPRSIPLVVMSTVVTSNLMGLSQIFSRVRIVKSPASGESILKALRELTTVYGDQKKQVHPRYLTDQDIVISSELHGTETKAIMRNLSLSGIYFECLAEVTDYKATDVVKINVQLGAPPRDYFFDAKIVWAKSLDTGTGWGFGATFVDKDEVYNHLLKGF
jgi:hypothetical protein